MRHASRRCLLIATALLATAGPGSAVAAPDAGATARARPSADARVSTANRARLTRTLVSGLRRKGFHVRQGYPKLWTQQDCERYTYPTLHTCYGNNPVNPYVVPVVKSWSDEFVDPATVNALGKTRSGYSSTYRLDPREAIVVFGTLPPPARYMGLQSWVWTREWLTDDQPWDPSAYTTIQARAPQYIDYLFNTVPRDPSRILSFSTLSNNINNVVIQRQSGAAFGQTRYFVITPDRGMDRAVRRSLGRLGVRMQDVFTEPIPPSHPLGLDRKADDFVTLIRYALPNDKQAGDAWLRDLPLTVLRVRARGSSPRAQEPFPPFVADPRTAVPEDVYAPDLATLAGQVCARWGDPCETTQPDGTRIARMFDLQLDLGDFGPQCRAVNMDCLGDGQDASYFIAPGRVLDPGWVYAVVGTLGTATGNATYVGLSVNDLSKLEGVLNIPDTQLTGSAAAYAGAVANTDKLFVHYFARNCAAISGLTDGACTTLTPDMIPLPGPGNRGVLSLALRSYVRPGTARGPLSSEQLRPLVIRFAAP